MTRIIPIWTHQQSARDNPNPYFCMAPWTHTYISPQSERRLCCASREQHSFQKQYIDASNDKKYGEVSESKTALADYQPVSLSEHWNSEYMRAIRVKLMAGEKIPQCDVCNDNLLMVGSYKQWFTGSLFPHKIHEAFDKTDDSGYTTMEPISFDYRYSNLCNFKCRMCGEQLSSAWEAEKKQNGLWSPKNQSFMIPEVKTAMQHFQHEVVEPEFKDAISRGIVEEIYWVGGEPLMYDVHWWAMDEMIKNGSAKNCYIRYNSNLSKVRYGKKELYQYFSQCKDWMMCASMDGTGAIAEYIRTGLKWDEWLTNFKEGVALPNGNNKMKFDLTLTGPGMFALKDVLDLCLELDVEIITKITYAFHPDVLWSPMSWPRPILNAMIDDLVKYMVPKATIKQQSLIKTLLSMKNDRQTHAEAFPDIYKQEAKKGKAWVGQLEKLRNDTFTMRDIYAENPELLVWWDTI
jgi:hypothetical protein